MLTEGSCVHSGDFGYKSEPGARPLKTGGKHFLNSFYVSKNRNLDSDLAIFALFSILRGFFDLVVRFAQLGAKEGF